MPCADSRIRASWSVPLVRDGVPSPTRPAGAARAEVLSRRMACLGRYRFSYARFRLFQQYVQIAPMSRFERFSMAPIHGHTAAPIEADDQKGISCPWFRRTYFPRSFGTDSMRTRSRTGDASCACASGGSRRIRSFHASGQRMGIHGIEVVSRSRTDARARQVGRSVQFRCHVRRMDSRRCRFTG